jgi:hypothetical protein
MTLKPYPKRIKKQLTRLSMEAHERELERELSGLAEQFDEWRAGKISAGELGFLVHDYDTGPLRELFKFYNRAPVHMRVACAVAQGILTEDEIPEEVLPYIAGGIEFYRSDLGEMGENSEPEGASS